MKAKEGDAQRRFEEVVAALAGDRRLAPIAAAFRAEKAQKRARRFGSSALKVNGKMFAMVVRDRLVVKLPRERAAELVANEDGVYFDPGHGRLMKEWVVIVDGKRAWEPLIKEAHGFVAQPASPRPARKRSER